MASLDTESFVGVKFSGSKHTHLLPMQGSSAVEDPALQKVFLAGNASFEAVNFIRGLSQPVVDLLTIPHKSWFNYTNLTAMLTARNGSTGMLPSVGPIAYRVGSGVGADEVAGSFTGSFVSTFLLGCAGRGMPVTCRMGLLPCGTPGQAFSLDTLPVGSTGFFMSDGASFNSQLTEVEGWQLLVMNNFVPDTALPVAGAVPLVSNPLYVQGYLSGPIGVTLTLIQKSGAVVLDNADLSALNLITISMTSVEADAGNQATLHLHFQGTKPPKNSTQMMGVTKIARSYVGQADDNHPSLYFTA